MKLFIVAGEASGDQLGGKLIPALRARVPRRVCRRRRRGDDARRFSSLFPMSDIAVMGVLPVIARLPTLLARIDQTAGAVIAASPTR